jgi:hypothetical protein
MQKRHFLQLMRVYICLLMLLACTLSKLPSFLSVSRVCDIYSGISFPLAGGLHCKKKESVSALLRNMALHMTDDSLSSKRNIFTATHSVFLHQIDRGSLASTRRGFFPAYRMGIRKNSNMVGKILTWWEKFLLGNGTWSEKFLQSEKFRHGWKKRQGGVYMKA